MLHSAVVYMHHYKNIWGAQLHNNAKGIEYKKCTHNTPWKSNKPKIVHKMEKNVFNSIPLYGKFLGTEKKKRNEKCKCSWLLPFPQILALVWVIRMRTCMHPFTTCVGTEKYEGMTSFSFVIQETSLHLQRRRIRRESICWQFASFVLFLTMMQGKKWWHVGCTSFDQDHRSIFFYVCVYFLLFLNMTRHLIKNWNMLKAIF